MSEPTGTPTRPDAPTRDEERPEPLTFTLQIISPSIGVTGPLSFPLLPATTTVKQLKAKIRDALPSKPADESQRLIHRGRMLARETEMMLEIFGQETLTNPEPQTLHLVLRPTASEGPSTRTPAPIPAAAAATPQAPTLNPPGQQFPRPQSTPANPVYGMHTQQPLPGFQHVQQHQVLHQVEHIQNIMAQRLQQLQRETQRLHQEMGLLEQRARTQAVPGSSFAGQQPPGSQNPTGAAPGLFQLPLRQPPAPPAILQNLINQQQRGRAAEGRHGIQDAGGNTAAVFGPTPPSASGRASPNIQRPEHTATYTREGVGPNGERWHMTVNETTTTVPPSQSQPQSHPHHHHHQHAAVNPALDIQAVLRNADRFLAAQGGRINMQRSASVPPASSAPFAPGTGRPGTPGSINTPATTSSSPLASLLPNPPTLATWNPNPQQAAAVPDSSNGPMVYILSSPSGPRALLVNNTETFFTPRQHSRRHQSPAAVLGQEIAPVGFPEYRNRPAQRVRRHRQQQDGAPLEPINAPHANPGGGALAARVGPLIWLVVRLVGFVWFFTAGNPSWTRWLMVSGLAFAVFIINTGIFDGLAEQIWGPVRRHLAALLPLAPPAPRDPELARINEVARIQAAQAQAQAQQVGPAGPAGNEVQQQPRRHGELDPAQVAAHLLERHRQANAGWLITQIRRAEHSLLLFLASLVPGVGEAHVRAREQENAAIEEARQRQIAAAEAATAAENAESNADGETAERSTNTVGENRGQAQSEDQDGLARQPLVEV